MTKQVKWMHQGMAGAPVLTNNWGSLTALLDACLVTGWGLLSATSASVSAGVCTLNFASTHSFEPLNVALIAGAGVGAGHVVGLALQHGVDADAAIGQDARDVR